MKKNTVNPKTLKGNDQMNRIHELMGKITPNINESKNNSVLENFKKGPDGNVYGIVRENHKYYMKIAENKKNLGVNDFQYIGGLKNKENYVYESYAKAAKQLKLKFINLEEAYGVEKDNDTNILTNEAFSMGFEDDQFDSAVEDNDYSEETIDNEMPEDEMSDNQIEPSDLVISDNRFGGYDLGGEDYGHIGHFDSDEELNSAIKTWINDNNISPNIFYINDHGNVSQWNLDESLDTDKSLDPVGQEDADIDNDGDTDQADAYLRQRRHVISNKVQEKFGLTKEEAEYLVNESLDTDKSLDPVGQEDADIDNDGDTDQADAYLRQRRHVISNKVQEKFGLTKEEAEYLVNEILEGETKKKRLKENNEKKFGGYSEEQIKEMFKNKSFKLNFASWFTGTSLCDLEHPEYGGHKITPQQIKYSPKEYKDDLYRCIANHKDALIGGDTELEETKYKLKVDDPNPADPEPELPSNDGFKDDNGGAENFNDTEDETSDDKPFDDEPFDAGVEASEEEDPEKFIQQLSGKLGNTLRKYTEERGNPDFDLEKFAINSVLSATHTAEMDDEDKKDIIKKVKTSGEGEEDVDVDVDVNTGQDDDVDLDVDRENNDNKESLKNDDELDEGIGYKEEQISQQEKRVAKSHGIDIIYDEKEDTYIWKMIGARKIYFSKWEEALNWLINKLKNDDDLYEYFYFNLGSSDILLIGNHEFVGNDIQDHLKNINFNENLVKSKKNSIFEDNKLKNVIMEKLNETVNIDTIVDEVLGDHMDVQPETKPGEETTTEPKITPDRTEKPRRERIWNPEPGESPDPKAEN